MNRRLYHLLFAILLTSVVPAAAQAACTQLGGYPFSANGCLNSNDLNLSLELSQGPLPPQNNSGQGARYGKLWLDTSVTPPTLRQCNVATCSKTYNSTEWALWGFLDPTNGWQWNTTFVVHTPVVAASNGALINSPTYNNGISGIGATLTASSNGALTVGGFSPATNDRVLIKDQIANVQNGIYTVTQTGNGSNPYVLTRATDFDQPSEFVNGAFVASSLQFQSFVTTEMPVPVTVGSTPVTFVTFLTGTPASSGNPTAIAGPTAINGSSTFFMRSDAAPAVQTATSVQRGLVQPDNSTITVSGGTISVPLLVSPPTNSIAVTSAGGVASWSTTLPTGLILGTPSSITLINGTGLPISTGISGLGTGIATFLSTPSSANLRSALTDETGTGAAYFQNGDAGTPSALVCTNCTSIPAANLTGTINVARLPSTVFTAEVVQVFTTSGTYTPTAGLVYAVAECIGGGGGGGASVGTAGSVTTGGGGGAGAYSRVTLTAASIGASKAVTIGAAGTGGVSGGAAATVGGDTSVGTLCVAKGGSIGAVGSSGSIGSGGAGGDNTLGTGDVRIAGNGGQNGFLSSITNIFPPASQGGAGPLGGQVKGSSAGAGAVVGGVSAGANYGSGGGGGQSNNTTSGANGGNGSTGLVVITEFVKQ